MQAIVGISQLTETSARTDVENQGPPSSPQMQSFTEHAARHVYGQSSTDAYADRGSFAMHLARWLVQIRCQRGLSQESVALVAGISVSTYSRIERGFNKGRWANPRQETLLRLLVALNVGEDDVQELLAELCAVRA